MRIRLADRVSHVQEYYFSAKLREIAAMRRDGVDVINMGIGSPDLAPSDVVIDRLHIEAKLPDNHGYQSYIGIPELRDAIASWYERKFEVTVRPESEILPLIGSKEGIMHLSMTYGQEGDEILVPNPGYPTYRSAASLAGATVREYRLNAEGGWLPDLEQLEREGVERVQLMWINYPHMPTGAKASIEDFQKMIEFAQKHEILLCHDNPYAFVLNDEPISLLQIEGAKEVSVELGSLSKTFNMAGWRVGFMVASEQRIKEVLRFKSNMDSGMFRAVQLAAVEALQLGEDWYVQVDETYRSRRAMALKVLERLGCEVDPSQAGMFLWGKIPSRYRDAIALADELLYSAHVFLTPGSVFGSNGNRYIRLSLCNDVAIMEEGLARINSFFAQKQDL